MNKEERITYEEFMTMFKNAPRIAYMLYDKAEDEIDRLNNIISELEKYLINLINNEGISIEATEVYEDVFDKLKELKEKK